MAKIHERVLSTIKLRENRQDSFDPQRENLLGEDSICMVNLLEIPQVIFCFSNNMIHLFRLFQTRTSALSSKLSKSKCRHYRYTVRSIHVKL